MIVMYTKMLLLCVTCVFLILHSVNSLDSPDYNDIRIGGTQHNADPISAKYDKDLTEFHDVLYLTHSHATILDPDGVITLQWTPYHEKQEVQFTLSARTLGWIGLGISENGAMDGADMVTLWVKDGRLFLQDRHGVGQNLPPVDSKGNWRPIAALENSTHTVARFSRQFDTCDPQDFPLTNETTRFIYAWGPADPSGTDPPYHGPHRRGSKMSLALLPFHEPSYGSSDLQTWIVNLTTSLPPNKDTLYWCHVEKIPQMSKKHHYVGFKMIYGENARQYLHHSVAFECRSIKTGQTSEDVFQQYIGHPGHECYTPNMPDDFNACERFFINWAIGSEGEQLPSTVGIPMGEEHGGPTYIMFGTHYDNPSLKKDIQVSWAMDIYYTDVLRKNEAGNVAFGHAMNFGLTIPPGQADWLTAGHCSEHCTKEALPSSGIRVFNVFLHGHYLARSIRLRHFRGDRELPNIAEERNYDANFQQSRALLQELIVMPGDHFTVECDYDSRERTKGTFTGWKSRDEMCQAFINYYPRIDMMICRSTPTVPTLRTALDMPTIPSGLDLSEYIFDMELTDGGHYQQKVNSIDWARADVATINKIMSHGEHYIKCAYNNQVKMQIGFNTTTYPAISHHLPPLKDKCASSGMRKTDKFAHAQTNHASSARSVGNIQNFFLFSILSCGSIFFILY